MVQQPNQPQQAQQVGARINLREVQPGERLRLIGDVVVEVLNNPEDGMWVRAKYISVPANPTAEGTEDQIFAADVIDKA